MEMWRLPLLIRTYSYSLLFYGQKYVHTCLACHTHNAEDTDLSITISFIRRLYQWETPRLYFYEFMSLLSHTLTHITFKLLLFFCNNVWQVKLWASSTSLSLFSHLLCIFFLSVYLSIFKISLCFVWTYLFSSPKRINS